MWRRMATPGTQGSPAAAPTSGRSAVQWAAIAVGAVFLLVGILGFIPGVTTDYDTMTFAGHHSEAKLLGLFNVSGLHNAVHLLFGVVGLALSGTFRAARWYLVGGGIVYAVLFVYGLADRPRLVGELRPREHRRQLAAPRSGRGDAGAGHRARSRRRPSGRPPHLILPMVER